MSVHALLHDSVTPEAPIPVQRTTPPFRADHVGSLLRPPELLAAREQYRTGTLDAARLQQLEDQAILEVVRRQEELGLSAVTDGEFRRTLWHIDFLKQFANVEVTRSSVKVSFHTEQGDTERAPSALKVTGKLARPHPIFVEHYRYLQSIARVMPKLTLPSPSILHFRGGREAVDRQAYPDPAQFYAGPARGYA